MRDRIQEALKRSKADYTEIRIEEKETTRVVFQRQGAGSCQCEYR